MPTKTFFNLPLEKQKKLMEASKKEFSRVDYATASINQIIHDAGIPRGSFYMYFQDKEDLYFYLVETEIIQMFQRIEQLIEDSNGDFIAALETFREEVISICLREKQGQLLRQMFLNLRHATERKIWGRPHSFMEEQKEHLLQKINPLLYQYSSREMLLDSFGMVMTITMNSIVCTILKKEERKVETENYQRRLNIIRYGVLKKEDVYV